MIENVIVSDDKTEENMVQAIVTGSSCVVKSTLTPDEIKRMQKLHPEAMAMYDDDDEVLFTIGINEHTPGEILEDGAVYGGATMDGKATINVLIDPESSDRAALVYEKLAKPLLLLNELEGIVRELLPDLEEEEEKVRSMIKVL